MPDKRGAVRRVGNACRHAHFLELLPAKIVEQKVGSRIVRHKSIQEPIAIIIREGNAHALAHVRRRSPFPGKHR